MSFPTSYGAPGLNNAYVPTFDDSANLIVGYSRNEKDFALNQYVSMQTVNKMIGFWLKFNPKDQARVPYAQGDNWVFADGQRRSLQDGKDTNSRHGYVEFSLKRFSPKGTIGYLTAEQAQWDVKKKIIDDLAFKCMTQRVVRTNAVMTTTSEYASDHTGTATALGGGLWSAGTTADPYIKETLGAVRNRILLDTLGKVKPSDLCLVINPNLAKAMAGSAEIHQYLAQQENSGKVLEGTDPNIEDDYGIPRKLYGFKVVVENAVRVSALADTTPDNDTISFIQADNDAFICARPGGINGEAGGSAFASITMLQLKGEEMVPEMFDIAEDKLFNFYLTDSNQPILNSPESFFYVTNCLS